MKKSKLWLLAAILFCGLQGATAQALRSDEFRAKYELKEVVVMSRHNIRSPLSSGAAYQRVTPHQWFAWSSPGSQLSLRGGVLETEMGQFFRKWVVGEGLLPDNYRPEGDEVLTPNADGLYRLSDIDARMAEAMTEYESIEDVPTTVRAATAVSVATGRTYTLNGTPATSASHGIIIQDQQKLLRKRDIQ